MHVAVESAIRSVRVAENVRVQERVIQRGVKHALFRRRISADAHFTQQRAPRRRGRAADACDIPRSAFSCNVAARSLDAHVRDGDLHFYRAVLRRVERQPACRFRSPNITRMCSERAIELRIEIHGKRVGHSAERTARSIPGDLVRSHDAKVRIRNARLIRCSVHENIRLRCGRKREAAQSRTRRCRKLCADCRIAQRHRIVSRRCLFVQMRKRLQSVCWIVDRANRRKYAEVTEDLAAGAGHVGHTESGNRVVVIPVTARSGLRRRVRTPINHAERCRRSRKIRRHAFVRTADSAGADERIDQRYRIGNRLRGLYGKSSQRHKHPAQTCGKQRRLQSFRYPSKVWPARRDAAHKLRLQAHSHARSVKR